MRCPFCKEDRDKVIDSRSCTDLQVIRRRRQCLACSKRFTTYERVEENPIRVVKKDGRREGFERRKLMQGMMLACGKRPISIATIDEITRRIEDRIAAKFDREVPAKFIGQQVMRELKKLDAVAYVRFASVYREFQGLDDFVEEVEKAKTGRRDRDPEGA
ncbi:MAG: transcriptional regulator NrdR [Planctomycetes bacterium]|jgi:transcriptional repressor NrdR|nr:transcriptional regulator NrdR [Planctomycetota bacterium]